MPFHRAQKVLDFQGPNPLPLALVLDLPASKPLRTGPYHRSINSYIPLTGSHSPPLPPHRAEYIHSYTAKQWGVKGRKFRSQQAICKVHKKRLRYMKRLYFPTETMEGAPYSQLFFIRFEANLSEYGSYSLHICIFRYIRKHHLFASFASYSHQNIRTNSHTNKRFHAKQIRFLILGNVSFKIFVLK
jgi:hypothetical protein